MKKLLLVLLICASANADWKMQFSPDGQTYIYNTESGELFAKATKSFSAGEFEGFQRVKYFDIVPVSKGGAVSIKLATSQSPFQLDKAIEKASR